MTKSSLNAQEIIETLESIGWFSNYQRSEKEDLQIKLINAFAKDPSSAFFTLAVFSFDVECIDGRGDYENIIESLAKSSFGKFNPQNVKDDFDFEKKVAMVSFIYQGKEYSVNVSIEDDWFQFEVIDLINQSLREADYKEQFLSLPARDQSAELVFVSNEIYAVAVSEKIIPEGDVYFE